MAGPLFIETPLELLIERPSQTTTNNQIPLSNHMSKTLLEHLPIGTSPEIIHRSPSRITCVLLLVYSSSLTCCRDWT